VEPEAVIFDFYGTLAHWVDTTAANYTSVFPAFGYAAAPSVLDAYFSRYDAVDQSEHFVSEDAYEASMMAEADVVALVSVVVLETVAVSVSVPVTVTSASSVKVSLAPLKSVPMDQIPVLEL
jgi:hypothetical protein